MIIVHCTKQDFIKSAHVTNEYPLLTSCYIAITVFVLSSSPMNGQMKDGTMSTNTQIMATNTSLRDFILLQIAVLLQQKKTSVSFRKGDEVFLLANFEVFSPRSENHLCFLVFSQENLRKTLKFARRKPSSPFRKEIGVAKDLQFVVLTAERDL